MLTNRQIFIGVDLSESGLAAVREGCRLAGSCAGKVTAVHVVELPGNMAMEEGLSTRLVDLEAIYVRRARERWQEWSNKVGTLPEMQFATPVGSPASTLLDLSQPLSAALLVLGINSSMPY